ncbi:Ribonuclease Le2 [Escovopsis weberi]|uniref:ribonuclease T2 n=1 Tax=Escovopsis weberi TaxID=150374 RepID=A0A0M9VSU1_ESCWE|nr:Ribonuclease Le2 [Escovopsis weberi]
MHRSGLVVFSLIASAYPVAAGLYPGITATNHTCALSEPVLSCSDQAVPGEVDTCCVETFGGLILQTQFWSVFTGLESEGQLLPANDWTIHGLWPDFCNGSFTQYCDLSRQYDPKPAPNTTDGTPTGTPVPPYTGPSIESLFAEYGKGDLLAYMNKYWINQFDKNWLLWAHEFSKHATCFSTFQKECFAFQGPKASEFDDLFYFFETVIGYYKVHPTWGWLSAADIRPSNTTSYSFSDIQAALTTGYGVTPFIGCGGPRFNETEAGKGSLDNGGTQLNEMWYYYHVFGGAQRQQGVRLPADVAAGSVTTCAKAPGAIWYYERAPGSEAGSETGDC